MSANNHDQPWKTQNVREAQSGKGQFKYLEADLDHIALQTHGDALVLASWYTDVLQFEPIDFAEYRDGTRPFPSVRISRTCILDFFGAGAESQSPQVVRNANHICFAVRSRSDLEDLMATLRNAGFPPMQDTPLRRSGARGDGYSVYVSDPDGNMLEFRAYDDD
jgi:catechol 2,3-dioxygenase-like lactoylglutathione lyase family enzyme